MYLVYKEVLVMENNKLTKKIIYSVCKVMNYIKTSIDIIYFLVTNKVGVATNMNPAITYKYKNMFKIKEELIFSL